MWVSFRGSIEPCIPWGVRNGHVPRRLCAGRLDGRESWEVWVQPVVGYYVKVPVCVCVGVCVLRARVISGWMDHACMYAMDASCMYACMYACMFP